MNRKPLTHDEAVLEVYRLTPQIREYDEFMYLGVRWLPYTMFFHHKNYKSDVINTDEFGFRAVEDRVSIHDLHATMLYLLGVDHEKLTYRYAGRDFRLTDVQGQVVHDIVA